MNSKTKHSHYNFHFKIMTFYTFYLNTKKDFTLSPDRIFFCSNICHALIEYTYYSNGKKQKTIRFNLITSINDIF